MNDNRASIIAVNVLAAPNTAFATLKERPTLLAPLLLLLAAAAVATFLYMNGVDIVWFFEERMQRNPDVNADQIERFNRLIENVPQVGIAVTLSGLSVLGVGFVLLLTALYYKIVTWITRDQVSYQHWFSMVCWCALPSLLSSLASIVNLLTADVSLMPQEAVNPLTFANLAGLEAADDGVGQLLAGYDPPRIWSLVLMILCYRTFTARSLTASAGIVLVPTVLIVSLTLLT